MVRSPLGGGLNGNGLETNTIGSPSPLPSLTSRFLSWFGCCREVYWASSGGKDAEATTLWRDGAGST